MGKVLTLPAGNHQRFLVDVIKKLQARFSTNAELSAELNDALQIALKIKVVESKEVAP